jgi:hypothetical protein
MSEQESTEVLRRIRTGVGPEAILSQIREGNLLMQLALIPEVRRVYEFPYMSDMPDYLFAQGSPYTQSLLYEAASSISGSHGVVASQGTDGRLQGVLVNVLTSVKQSDPVITAYI